MHIIPRLLVVAFSLVVISAAASADDAPLYELRIYTCAEGKLPALLERFENHTCDLFEKHGMVNVAYWVPTDAPDSETKLYYILRHESADAAVASWEGFISDPEWQAVAEASQQEHGQILAEAPESIYMTATDYSPEEAPCERDQVFELRIYTAAEGRLDRLHARFRDHTCDLFEKHGMHNIGYWVPTSGPTAENTLIYVLGHDSREAAAASWQAFIDDPEWQEAKAASEPDGSLLAEPPQSVYMELTDWSPAAEEKPEGQ
jgi:hypothetical protein